MYIPPLPMSTEARDISRREKRRPVPHHRGKHKDGSGEDEEQLKIENGGSSLPAGRQELLTHQQFSILNPPFSIFVVSLFPQSLPHRVRTTSDRATSPERVSSIGRSCLRSNGRSTRRSAIQTRQTAPHRLLVLCARSPASPLPCRADRTHADLRH
jgi:hypothetical protein